MFISILVTVPVWQTVLLMIVGLLVGAVLGFFISRVFFKKYLKKHPPITEAQIRVMFQQMGVPASEKRIKQIMKSMKEAQ